LGPKEGLGLLNGTQNSTAMTLKGLFLAEDLFSAAIATGALSIEAGSCSRAPFDERIHQARGQQSQIDAAAALRDLLGAHSEIGDAHIDCDRVQDPYSMRCMPQVMGAILTQIRNGAAVLEIEANAASDNPLVFTDNGDVLSGGNFHAEPVAMVADNLALAFSEMAAISERRISYLVDPHMSRLPPFLVEDAGVNSGFMIAHYTAAALASQNKTLSFPSCVDSLPTSANQEDIVSMAPNGARRLWEMAENLRNILAIELLAAVQGLDFKKGLKTSPKLETYKAEVRKHVKHWDKDRFFAPDIEAASKLIESGYFDDAVADKYLPSRA
jgi:histidine ammonia-lyase